MGRITEALAAAGHARYVVVGRAMFAVRRIDTDELRQVGFAQLEGSSAAKQAEAQIADERRQGEALIRAMTPGEAREAEAKHIGRLRELQVSRFRSMIATPDGDRAFMRRCNAYICASVTRVGTLLEGVVLPDRTLIPDDEDPAGFAEDARSEAEVQAGAPPVYSEPIQFVQDEADHKPSEGRLWVHLLSVSDRFTLGQAIMDMQTASVVREVLPFRGGSRGRQDLPPTRGDVRTDASRDPAVEPVRDGVQPAGDGARSKGRARADREGRGSVPRRGREQVGG